MILASQSPRRIQLMEEAGFDVQVMPADIDESHSEEESASDLVQRLARTKALAIASKPQAANQPVLAADTIVALNGHALGKPSNASHAAAMLRELSGATHQVVTGVCIVIGDRHITFADSTDVTFYELTQAQIEAYVKTGEPMDKAGAYGIQGTYGRLLVKSINGDFYNVMGLPIAHVVRELENAGITPTLR